MITKNNINHIFGMILNGVDEYIYGDANEGEQMLRDGFSGMDRPDRLLFDSYLAYKMHTPGELTPEQWLDQSEDGKSYIADRLMRGELRLE